MYDKGSYSYIMADMRTLILIALCLAGAPAHAENPLPGPVPARVERVVDADTVEVRARIWPGHEVLTRVRLEGADAPETWRPRCEAEREAGEAASGFVQARLPEGAEAALREVRLGSFAGRVIARLTLEDGRDLSDLLIAAGHAVPHGEDGAWCPREDRGG